MADYELGCDQLAINVKASPASDAQRIALEAEITAFFEQWRAPLFRYLFTFGLSPHDAEEVVQEVFLSLFSHLRKNGARTNLRGWVFRVAHNIALEQRSQLPRQSQIDENQHRDPTLNPEEELASRQRQERLHLAVQSLAPLDQRCLALRTEGFRYREIAEILGISMGSVSSSLERSLVRLQRATGR